MLDPHYILSFELIITFAAFAQGFTGLGCGIIAMAGVAFMPWDLERASVVMNILLIMLNCTIIFSERKYANINLTLVGVILIGEIVGVPLGYWFLNIFGNKPIFRPALGATLILFAGHALFRPCIRTGLHLIAGTLAGAVGGFFAGAFTAGGPFFALFIYSRYENPSDAKGTLQIVLMAATLWRLFNIFFFGKGVTCEVLRIAAISIPSVVGFAILGNLLTKRFSNETFLKIVYSFIGAAGFLNILKGMH